MTEPREATTVEHNNDQDIPMTRWLRDKAEYIQDQPAASALKFKNRRKLPCHRLPFVEAGRPGETVLWWAVPKTGGYSGGCETGRALARIYMKYLGEKERWAGGTLQHLVLDMIGSPRSQHGENPELDALRGQVVGFFGELDRWLIGAAKHLGDGLERQDNKTLLKIANAGLSFDEESYCAAERVG